MRTTLPLLWLMLHRRRRLLLALAVGLVIFETLIVVVAGLTSPEDLLAQKGVTNSDSFDAFAGSSGGVPLASVAGLLGAGLLHPFWIALQLSAVGSLGAALLAADIEDGTIELIAVRPVSRSRILAERLGALLVTCTALGIAAVLPYAVAIPLSATVAAAIDFSGTVAAAVAGIALVLAFTGVAVLASCAMRRRSAVFATIGGVAAVAYAVNFIAETWDDAHALRWLSPFHYYQPADALVFSRYDAANLTVLLAAFAVLSVAGFIMLKQRDLTH